MLLAHLKRILGLGRLRLRGPCGANHKFLRAATAQNLRKLAKIFPAPQQTRKARQKRLLQQSPVPAFCTRERLFFHRAISERRCGRRGPRLSLCSVGDLLCSGIGVVPKTRRA